MSYSTFVKSILQFDSIEEAIHRANDTRFGLAAGVCSQNIATAMGIAKRLHAGTIWINIFGGDVALPFGGFKESGWGRENGEYALENFTEVKMIQFPINHY